MAIWLSSGFSHLQPGAFHMLYKHTTDATYIIENGRKKNKQAQTWVNSKHKKGEVWALLCGFLCIYGYHERVSVWNSHTVTRNADSSSRVGWPGFWVHRFQLLAWQLPFSDCHFFLTVANSFLLFTALGPCLSLSSSGLIGNLAHKPFVWVSCQNRQRNPLTGTHLHPQKWMPCIMPQ